MPTPTLPPLPEPDFIRRTNDEYAAWCKTHYQPNALDDRGMASLHGLWAWQEQERRFAAQAAEIERLTAALNRSAYALFQIKRMAPPAVPAFAATEHAAACVVLDGATEPQPPTVKESLTHDAPLPQVDAFAIRNACPRGYSRCGWDAVAHQCVADGCAPWQPQPITTKEPE